MRRLALPLVLLCLAPAAAQPDPLPDIIKRLKAGNAKAAREAAKLGKAGRPAARALCELALASADSRGEAVDALEAVAPDLAPHVLVLLVDRDLSKQEKAARNLAQLGESASPSLPVLLAAANRTPGTEGTSAAQLAAAQCALADVAPNDPATLNAITRLVERAVESRRNEATLYLFPLLGTIGHRSAAGRKQVASALLAVLNSKEWQAALTPDRFGMLMLSLALQGDAAKEAAPALRQLKLHEDEKVRLLARAWLDRFPLLGKAGGAKGGPKTWVSAVPAEQAVAQNVYFLAGTPAFVWITAEAGSALNLRIIAPDGSVAVQGNAIPLAIWQPRVAGVHRIEVRNNGDAPSRLRIKHN